jgi:hypothetical protein
MCLQRIRPLHSFFKDLVVNAGALSARRFELFFHRT